MIIKGHIVVTVKPYWEFLKTAKIRFQLVSATHENKLGKPAYMLNWTDGDEESSAIDGHEMDWYVDFEYEEDMGLPGAVLVQNHFWDEFHLVSLTLDPVPGHGRVHFPSNSWIYPFETYSNKDRIFFSNKPYLTKDMPKPLLAYIEAELETLKGDGSGELKEWDRVYDYATYNDLANPDANEIFARPILGGSTEFPYPRRGRTGRPPTNSDPNTESKSTGKIYVPRDEQFDEIKNSDFFWNFWKSAFATILVYVHTHFRGQKYNSFQEVLDAYTQGIPLPTAKSKAHLKSVRLVEAPTPSDAASAAMEGVSFYRFPIPEIVKHDKLAWKDDEEFGRQMLAGANPLAIRRLTEFPPTSNLDPHIYGDQTSTIKEEDVMDNLEGLSVEEAINCNRMYILDHHDAFMTYVRRINTETPSTKTYASRTLLFLKSDGTLNPIAIELSLPHPDGDQFGAVSKVYTPSNNVEGSNIWMMAKAYVTTNDSGHHQLISHWMKTHACIEPFAIATHRQLSVVHPIYKLLKPHFRDTMDINAQARQLLIPAGGIVESVFSPEKFCLEISSKYYKDWIFTDQAPPTDLIKRGMAVEDKDAPNGLRLLIEDYPYAVDAMEIWSAIQTWVEDYCTVYYKTDEMVEHDHALQRWWIELREKGHADKKDEPWWPEMKSRKDLIDSCCIIIWVASAHHSAVNFGQYDYGYVPSRPTISHGFMPEPGTEEYSDLNTNFEKAYMNTVNNVVENLVNLLINFNLSMHSIDEVYIGNVNPEEWTTDDEPLLALKKFQNTLDGIETAILARNKDPKWRNRSGPVKMNYRLLFPTSLTGVTGQGVPNSISI